MNKIKLLFTSILLLILAGEFTSFNSVARNREFALRPIPQAESLVLGNPSNATSSAPDNLLVVKPQFILSYNKSTGCPNWVTWHLEASDIGAFKRLTGYHPDQSLPADSRIRPSAYDHGGYDTGHMCPSDDRSDSLANNAATFSMSNMVPQIANLNRGVWKQLELYCQNLAKAGNELYIIAGPLGSIKTIGAGKVTVPKSTWKIVIVLPKGKKDLQRIDASTRVIAVNMKNINQGKGVRWTTALTTVRKLEEATGFNFLSNVSQDIQDILENRQDSGRAPRR